ncbi:MAG: TonB-dependent receptor [Pseudomonadota bacterium]
MDSYQRRFAAFSLLFITLFGADRASADDTIEEIIVSADLRERSLGDVAASVTVLDAAAIERLSVQHFEELTAVIPNLNWSGDGHRARYFQIRGVGELEQYQGAPNPSVGLLIDDIDFSGIGTVATLFDLERIEVLRGPQGTRYGANAIGGLIYLQSAAPTRALSGRVQLAAGDDDARTLGAAVGGAVGERAAVRVSAQHHESDGFRSNPFLGRDDTNGRDETTVRGKLSIEPSADWSIDVAALYADIDNGYDAFALDNSYTMLSDRPGRDAQESVGASVRIEGADVGGSTLTSITAYADSDIAFSFDADWGNPESWAPVTYDYVTVSERERQTLSQELRFASGDDNRLLGADWLLGVYALRLEESLTSLNQGEYFDPGINFADSLDDRLASDYEATNLALFGQIDMPVAASTTLSLGLRAERRSTDYRDSSGLVAGPDESMLGGELSLTHRFDSGLNVYATLARGYKAGGFNLGAAPDAAREFEQEGVWNAELGLRASGWGGRLSANLAVFASRRDDQQVRTSVQLVPGDPTTFVFFTDNAARGESYGLEADLRWRPADGLDLFFNLGLLDASFDRFVTADADLTGRDQAHAPNYSFALGGRYTHAAGWFLQLDANGKDEFYFDVSHDQKSERYELLNARAGFEAADWSLTLWVRNLTDERYAVRGFFFGNEPPDFPPTLYTRLGDPRQFGVRFDWGF